jgi:hypothetical protein
MSLSNKISSVIGNQFLASAIHKSVSLALRTPFVHLVSGKTVWDIFKHSLDAAIRDIEKHPQGKLFRRLIEYGPYNPDDPEALVSDGKTTLSDMECGSCVEFIYSHMINRFKGELAELLAIEPCITLIRQLQRERYLPSNVHFYWGEMIQERRRPIRAKKEKTLWGNFTKGADGLLVKQISSLKSKSNSRNSIYGIFEVKSMKQSKKKVLAQINSHIMRLNGGLKLGEKEYPQNDIYVDDSNLLRIIVSPSTWKLSREWHSVKNAKGRAIVVSEPENPPIQKQPEKLDANTWKITLAWSQEAIEQAAYEMTFWYMSQVGKHIYSSKSLPKGWEYMTPEQAGYNAIKMMLYYIPLRYITERQNRLSTRLYNVYSFGYPLGVDSKEMLWSEDFPGKG